MEGWIFVTTLQSNLQICVTTFKDYRLALAVTDDRFVFSNILFNFQLVNCDIKFHFKEY